MRLSPTQTQRSRAPSTHGARTSDPHTPSPGARRAETPPLPTQPETKRAEKRPGHQRKAAQGGAGPAAEADSASADGGTSVLQPTTNTGMKRPAGAPAPKRDTGTREESWYGRNTPTDQAKNAYSTQQTADKARRLTAELTGMHVKYRMALRQTLPGGITRPAEATDLGPSTVNCIRSALDAQLALAEAIMADLGDLAERGPPSATTILGSFQPDVPDRTTSAAIKCGDLRVSLSAVEAVYGVFPFGQALAVLARGAWAPSGNCKLNRSTLDVIESQKLVAAGEFDPKAAVREIGRALQTAKRSRSTPNCDEISRALCGLYNSLPVRSAFIDCGLDLAKAITDKKKVALRIPCDILTMAHADAILHELSSFGASIDLRNTQRALAPERFSERPSTGLGAGGPGGGTRWRRSHAPSGPDSFPQAVRPRQPCGGKRLDRRPRL